MFFFSLCYFSVIRSDPIRWSGPDFVDALTNSAPAPRWLFKNLFMLSVRISSYGCTREVWRARKMRKISTRRKPSAILASWVLSKLPECIYNSIYAQLEAWTNSFITERHEGSARRSFFYRDRAQNSQKSKQTCLLAGQKHATFLFKFKFAKRATCKFFSALFLLLVGSGPKKSMPIEKLGSSSLVSSIF